MSTELGKPIGLEPSDVNKPVNNDGNVVAMEKLVKNEHLNSNDETENNVIDVKPVSMTTMGDKVVLKDNGLDSDEGELGKF